MNNKHMMLAVLVGVVTAVASQWIIRRIWSDPAPVPMEAPDSWEWPNWLSL